MARAGCATGSTPIITAWTGAAGGLVDVLGLGLGVVASGAVEETGLVGAAVGAFGPAFGAGGGAGAGLATGLALTGVAALRGGCGVAAAVFDPAGACRAGRGGAVFFTTGTTFRAVFALEDLDGLALRAGGDGLGAGGVRFAGERLPMVFFTAFPGSARSSFFFAGALRAGVPPERRADTFFTAGLGDRDAGTVLAAGFVAVFFFRLEEAAGRPLTGAAFFRAGRGVRRAGRALVRDLAMVRAR